MDCLHIHRRVSSRHPELSEDDVRHAWMNAVSSITRCDLDRQEHVALGFDMRGRLLEMVAIRDEDGNWLIYHAMTPPSKKTMKELGSVL